MTIHNIHIIYFILLTVTEQIKDKDMYISLCVTINSRHTLCWDVLYCA